jgi:predicted ATP-binding protein involved in virulence
MSHPDHGLLPLSLLSDGVRAVISLTADIAFRCARLNGHFGELAAKITKGVVLIDEVDLHLHPAWQQRILQSLQVAFPEIQFIVSTHSPQVLSTVASSCIRLVFQDSEEQWQAVNPAQEVKGLESAVALNDIMGVNPIPPIAEARWLAEYTALIESGKDTSDDGQKIYQDLITLYGQMHPVILNLEKLKRFQTIKLRNSKE